MMINIYSPNASSELEGIVPEMDVQPNAVDLRLGKVYKLGREAFSISNDKKEHRELTEIKPNAKGWFMLEPGYYNIEYENLIRVSEGESGFVITRSTLVRNGVYLTTGLYDSGYKGKMVSGMHVTTGNMFVEKSTRLGQYLCFEAEAVHLYDGDYQEKT